MKGQLSADLASTTLDTEKLTRYLFNVDPGRLRSAIDQNKSDKAIDEANHTDFFEVRLRFYVAGFRKTLHDTLSETRAFLRNSPAVAPTAISLVIIQMRLDFLRNEWYELIPRLEKAEKQIKKLVVTQAK